MKKTALFLLALIPALFLLVRGAQAQLIRSFTTIPPRVEIKVKPGDFIEETIKFRNEGDSAIAMVAFPNDFIVTNKAGTPVFVTERVSGRWSAASWISLDPYRFSISPKETIEIELTATIPEDALPGGHYAGILFQPAEITIPGAETGTIAGTGISQTIGSLVYLTVEGPIREQAIVKLFEVPFFQEFGPIPFTTEILNNSDIHLRPQGEIKVTNMLGRLSTTLPLEERNIFPSASYLYENTWEAKYLLGRYRAELNASYGSTGQVIEATAYFWVFPIKIVLALLLAIIIIILVLVLVVKKKREKKFEEEIEELEEEVEDLEKEAKPSK